MTDPGYIFAGSSTVGINGPGGGGGCPSSLTRFTPTIGQVGTRDMLA